MDFSTDGRYMALAERRDCKDYISVFVCDDWHLLRVSETHTHCNYPLVLTHKHDSTLHTDVQLFLIYCREHREN